MIVEVDSCHELHGCFVDWISCSRRLHVEVRSPLPLKFLHHTFAKAQIPRRDMLRHVAELYLTELCL